MASPHLSAATDPQLTSELLKLIQSVAGELKLPESRLRSLNLDTSFDRELGLDSLSRMEILARIEKHFQISLPEKLLVEAESPRDLMMAILSARGQKITAPQAPVILPESGAALPSPSHAQTLLEVLSWHCQRHPDRTHIQFYSDDGQGKTITYQQLLAHAENVAKALQGYDIQAEDTVAIMLPTDEDYFFSFFGILLAGAIPVPIYPPARPSQIEDHLLRHSKILNNCQAKALITIPEARHVARLLKSSVTSLARVLTPDHLNRPLTTLLPIANRPDDIALLQYTSGSTGTPKGVILSHFNLLSNIRAMGETVKADSNDVFFSWLPLYHDMGLIGAWLGSLYYGSRLVIMSPLNFLARPSRWLWGIHRYRATLTAAPNFAYELCLKRITAADLEGLDLSSLRAMFNGAEPVSPWTLERFGSQFKKYALDRKILMPVYGLAENSVGLTFPPLGRGPLIDSIQRDVFSRTGRAIPCSEAGKALRFVSCGIPLIGHEVRIVDHQGRELPERQEGLLEFRGPSGTRGYYRNPRETAKLFHGDWLRSGDRAYVANGEVYLTGREKDVVIHAGRNLYPQEIEEAVGQIEGIRAGCVAVFGSKDPNTGTERLVVLAESRETDPQKKEALETKINDVVLAVIGSAPDQVILASPGTVLKTSSGKIRRSACRERYEKGLIGKPLPVWKQFLHLALVAVRPQLRRWFQFLSNVSFAAWAWLMTAIIGSGGWLAALIVPGEERRWRAVASAARILARSTGIPLRTEGLEHLPEPGQACIFVSNHASYLDGAAIMAAIPRRFSFVAKKELAEHFISGIFLRRIGCEFVERVAGERSVRDAQRLTEAALNGRSLWFFPEGTFTRQPGLLPFHLGAFLTAAETGLPVVPVSIRGTRSILRAESWFPRRGAIQIVISPPLNPNQIRQQLESPSAWSVAVKLSHLARQAMLQKLGEPDLRHEQSPLLRG